MKNWFPIKKATASIATIALIVGQMASLPIANAANFSPLFQQEEGGPVYDLVLLVVDNTLSGSGNLVGLKNAYPDALSGADDLEARVSRYAEDLRDNNELTDVKIIFFDKTKDTVQSLANAIENIYLDGDTGAGHQSRLKGTVLIGDIPLPVVNKNGNRYISMFPYTDFIDKAYVYNGQNQSYEFNTAITYPKAEIWHGVMRAPTNDQSGKEKLAAFFDKNHLYYAGEPDYSEFGKKLFFGDLLHEEQKISGDMYGQYLKYLDYLEDIAYFRYNKFWAKELSGEVLESLEFNGDNPYNKPIDDGDPSTPDSQGFLAALSDGSAFSDMPDIYSRNIIENILAPYYKLVTKYLAKTNDWSEYTGRYKPEEVDSVAEIINVKDEYTKYYIKSVNDALEKKINEVVEKIQEPISIVDKSELSGSNGNRAFEVAITDYNSEINRDLPEGQPPVATSIIDSVIYRFNYYNEALNKNYINGIEAEVLESPKQCSVFLGSTRSDYYDGNLDFNPKAVNGVYSILVRALRSDNIATAAPKYTAGVNTRLRESGAVVEKNVRYGISAFLLNPLTGSGADYKNPWAGFLEEGDVITAVNGQDLSYEYTFDQAISEAYGVVEKVMDSINDNKLNELRDFPYKLAVYTEPPPPVGGGQGGLPEEEDNFQELMLLNSPQEIVGSERLANHEVKRVMGMMTVEYEHDGEKRSENISFTVELANGVKRPSSEDPAKESVGGPEVVVLFNSDLPGDFNFDAPGDGAIFSLYQGRNQGFGNGAYDSSAGCNYGSTSKNSDRCLAKVATMPVLDQGGSMGLQKVEIPGTGVKLKFPENVKKNSDGVNSGREVDHENHVDSFQIPENYKYEDIDEIYYDSCFNGLPAVGDLDLDSNLIEFPLNPGAEVALPPGVEVDPNDRDIDKDAYGRLMESFGLFVRELGDDRDLVPGDTEEEISEYKPKEELWLNMAKLDASEVVLHNVAGLNVSLKDFSDRYGLFDGKDNDNNGIWDSEDYGEASAIYGLPSGDLAQIARKLLSRTASYRVPGDAVADDRFEEDIVLNVQAHEIKQISSMIVHDEPTMDTINAQLAAMGAKSLPIDNPRYVAFQAKAESLGGYQVPKTVKVLYPNLFGEDIQNVAQFNALINSKADELASAPGSYKIFGVGASEEDYQGNEGHIKIKKEILEKYLLPVITNTADDPEDGFELKAANTKKIHDALQWKNMNIDEKHEYALKYYLNDAEELKAFAGESENGYEAAYLVMNGETDSFDFNFNKDVPEEKDTPFDPVVQMQEAAAAQEEAQDTENNEDEDFEFVWLDQFFEESARFLEAFTTVPTFENFCSSAENIINAFGGGGGNEEPAVSGLEQVQQAQAGNESLNKIELQTYTYLEIDGRSELEKLILEQAKIFKESQSGDDEKPVNENDPSREVDENAQTEGQIEAGKEAEQTNEGNDSQGEGGADVVRDLGSEEEQKSLAEQILTGEKPVNVLANTSFDKEIKAILDGEVGYAPEDTDSVNESTQGNTDGEKTVRGTDNENSSVEDTEGNIDEENAGGSAGKENEEGNADAFHWYDYYIESKYYERFLEQQESTDEVSYFLTASRLVAATSTDRLLAYIPDEQNPFIDAEENEETKYIVTASTNLVADGESLMKLTATIFNVAGEIATEERLKVKFEITDVSTGQSADSIATFEDGSTVNTDNGVATTYIRSGVHAGEFMVRAAVVDSKGNVDSNYLVVEKSIVLSAGEVASAEVSADSTILLANGVSSTEVVVTLKDANGNIVNDALNNVTVFSNDLAYIDPQSDQNSSAVGTQVAVFDGRARFSIRSTATPGVIDLVALVTDSELEDAMTLEGESYDNLNFDGYVGDREQIKVVRELKLNFQLVDSDFAPNPQIKADGSTLVRIGAELLADGEAAAGFNGKINFKLVSSELGALNVKPGVRMSNGKLNAANVNFKTSSTSGMVEIVAEIPGFVSDSLKFRSGEGQAAAIRLTASDTSIYTSGQDEVTLSAQIIDKNGNIVKNADGVQIDFKPTQSTKDFVKLSAVSSSTSKGTATIKVKGNKISGTANIIAEHDGLESGLISLEVKKHLNAAAIKELSPRALYISLLGEAFGNVKEAANAAQNLLYSGEVEAVTSITADGQANKQITMVDPYGKVEVLADTVRTEIRPATDSFPYQKLVLSEAIENTQLAEIFVVPKPESNITLQGVDDDFEKAPEGIVMKDLGSEATGVKMEKRGEDIYFVVQTEKGGEEVKAIVDRFGRVKILSAEITLRSVEEEDELPLNYFGFIIENKNSAIAAYKVNEKFTGVNVLGSAEARQNFRAGVYVKMLSDDKRYAMNSALTRASTGEADGVYILDLDSALDQASRPGFAQSSLEDARDKFGLGFEGDNKHMLLFSAGSSVGEANNLFASDTGIVFGDPMIRVKKIDTLISQDTHFTKDIGKNIFSGEEDVQQIVQMDYNGDERKDLILVYESGLVRLLENEISNDNFRDRGFILNISGGTLSMTAIDLDNDGYDDLIAGTREPCGNEKQCLSLFRNREGNLQREKMELALSAKVFEMKSEDMNKDECEDLVVSDDAGNIRIFNNIKLDGECRGLASNYVYGENFGYSIDPAADLASDLYVNYAGIDLPVDDPNVQSDDGVVLNLTLESSEPEASQVEFVRAGTEVQRSILENPAFAGSEIPPQSYSKEFGFLPIVKDDQLAVSTKKAFDLNGGGIALGDKIRYAVTLINSGGAINSLQLSDSFSGSVELDLESISCSEGNCGLVELLETGMSQRPYVIKGISLPPGATRTITYTVTVKDVAKVRFDIGNDFTDYPNNRNDGYKDILVKPEINPDNSLNYIYSVKEDSKLGYRKWNKRSENINADSLLEAELEKAGIDNIFAMLGFDAADQVPDEVKDSANKLYNSQTQDKDYNGCADSWQKLDTQYKDAAEAVTNAVAGTISALRCSGGGCLPNPYNKALLVPRWAAPGIAVFAAGVPNLLGISAFYPSSKPSTFRLYVSPTTTMGVGFAVCTGPSIGHTSPCYTFAVPGGVPGLCDGIRQSIDSAVASVPNAVVNPDLGMTTVVSDGGEPTDSKTLKAGNELLPEVLRDEKGESPLSASASVNIRIPGFPSVITNWIDKEIDEIYNKLMDPMKFYLILPDFQGFFSMAEKDHASRKKTDFLSLHDFLSTINRLPLVQIEGKEIVMKIPAVSKNQIEKYRYQARLWMKHMEKELEKYSTWNCDESPNRRNICDKLLLDIQELIASVQKLMDLLDRIENIPRDILNWRNMEAKYANQIICYLDTVMQFTGGYIHRQQKIIESWIKAAQDAIRTFKDWKVLLDAVIDYQQSCDQCKNDRFSDLGLLLNVFIALPELPVIPMPKLPDVVFDFSQIKTGVKFVWPDLVFKPEPILLPDLPTITLPDILPSVEIKIPGFDVPDIPNLVLPELPDLPPLPLPNLPDIPRPPRIPSIPPLLADLVANLKPIFKILCLLKNGVIPVPEGGLATEIETLTQPSIQVVLPLIKKLAIQSPEIQYDYVKEIRVTGKLNFDVQTDFIYDKAAEGAEFWNRGMKELVEEINRFTQAPYGDALSRAIQEAIDKAKEKLDESVEEASDDVSEVPESYNLVVEPNYLDPSSPLLNRSIAEIESNIGREDLPDNEGMRQLTKMRDGLIAYSKSIKEGTAAIEMMDEITTFDRALVNTDELRKVAEVTKVVDSGGRDSSTNTLEFGVLSPQTEAAIKEEVEDSKRLIADNLVGGEAGEPQADANAGGTGKPAKGFYVVGENGANENLINYTAELDGKVNTEFMDFDYDDDVDIVYSMGGEVYLKENYSITENMPKGEVIVGVNNNEVQDFVKVRVGSESETVTLIPLPEAICADKEPPLPSISKTEFKVSIFKPLVLDASKSFDPGGEVSEYYLETLPYSNGEKKVTALPAQIWSDLNLLVDQNGDGIPWNDKTNPILKVGPFTNEGDIGVHQFVLHVVDQAGNSSKQNLSIEVFAPEISLDATFARVPTASGETDPPVANMPFSLIRSRNVYRVVDEQLSLVPMVQKVITESADGDGKYHTGENGAYEISSFQKEDIILVQSAAGEVAAEVNGVNGNIGNTADGYKLEVVAAQEGRPMHIVIKDPAGRELGREYVIADPNIDVTVNANGKGVSILDMDNEDNYEFRKLGADDLGHPGGSVLIEKRESKQLAIIDTSGNIVVLDKKVKLRVKNNSLKKEELIIEMLAGQRVVGEVYIRALESFERVKIVGPNDVPFLEPNTTKASSIDGENLVGDNGAIRELFNKGILEGQKTDLGFEYRPKQMINRAEFVKVVLKMLCIIPSEDAYKAYAKGQGYDDISFKEQLDWYYPYIKEGTKLGLVEGYKGERDEESGLLPFRPDHTVSRAEATKIILQALELKGVLDLGDVKEGLPWYGDYMKVAQNLTPYLKNQVALKNNFLLTPEEANLPEEALNFEQLTEMALRVLDIYNCFEIDTNANNMSDFCEEKYEISDPSGDEDEDGLFNNLECLNNANPLDEDTDKGGVKDGEEFNLGTDILNPADDKAGQNRQRQKEKVVSGIYLVPAECNTCPCISTFANAADVLAGDTFFTAITNKQENFFFSKSEEVRIESTK